MNWVSNREQDSRTTSDDEVIGSLMMGTLCRRALVLIKHKVGTDGAVDEHMAWVLATWLQRQGISPVRNIPPTSLATPALGHSGVTLTIPSDQSHRGALPSIFNPRTVSLRRQHHAEHHMHAVGLD
jgi:hypothetical protein